MAIKRKKINYFEQPPRIFVSIECDSASIVRQTYNVVSGEYYPNRALFPLVLTPMVSYMNMDGSAEAKNAAPLLTDGHWYRFDNTTTQNKQFTNATEITNGSTVPGQSGRYSIDTNPGSETYGRLTTGENISPNNPVTYVFKASLKLNANAYEVTSSFSLDAVTVSVIPVLSFDNNEQAMYNPWDENMPKTFTINPLVYPKGLSATFRWLYFLNNAWNDIDGLPEAWAVKKSGNGIAIDRSVMPEEMTLKCIATVVVGGESIEIEKTISHRRRLPAFEVDINQVADITGATRQLNPKAFIQTGKKVVDNPGEEVSVLWYGSGTSAIATGMNPSIPISSLGSAMDLGLEVNDNGGYKLLLDDDGSYLTDDDGSFIILK